jgi:hypothetical protein
MNSKIILSVLFFFTAFVSNAQSRVVLSIKTGGDDLATRDFQENLKITIKVQGKPDFVLENANQGRGWPNNSLRTATIRLDESTKVEDIKEITLSRRNVGGIFSSGNDAVADNWNLQKVDAIAFIEKDGLKSKYNLRTVEGNPYFRFIYGPSRGANEGHQTTIAITQPILLSSTNASGTTITPTKPYTPVVAAPATENKIDIDLKTGSDNLEMKPHQKSVEIRIIIQNKPDVVLMNVNKDQNWPNNSIRRVTIPLPADITAEAIKEIHIYRTPNNPEIRYVWDLRDQDNWNLQSITAFATLKINGVKKRFDFEPIISAYRASPLYRFTYSSNNTETEGTTCKKTFTLKTAALPPAVNTDVPSQNAKLDITIGTGGDDLRGGNNDNADIILTFKSHPGKVYIRNIFNKRSLPNFSERKTTKDIQNSTTLDINDIKEVELHHTGGGGMGADNWDIDKVKISIVKDGQTKVLVDRVDTPIHRFTGDTRIKRFLVTNTN